MMILLSALHAEKQTEKEAPEGALKEVVDRKRN